MAAALYLRIVLNDTPPYSRVLIITDSDCDGFTSAAIIYQYTKQVNCHCQVDYWLHEGKQHGLQDHIDRLLEENVHYDLIILPDSSSNDAHYHDMLDGIHIPCLILDHHLTDVPLSDNAVVVNNQLSPNYKNKELTGAGVVYQFCRYFFHLQILHFVHLVLKHFEFCMNCCFQHYTILYFLFLMHQWFCMCCLQVEIYFQSQYHHSSVLQEQ